MCLFGFHEYILFQQNNPIQAIKYPKDDSNEVEMTCLQVQ